METDFQAECLFAPFFPFSWEVIHDIRNRNEPTASFLKKPIKKKNTESSKSTHSVFHSVIILKAFKPGQIGSGWNPAREGYGWELHAAPDFGQEAGS